MGSIISSKYRRSEFRSVTNTNPSPTNFNIAANHVVNGRSILAVHYPNCTTFQGKKLLLLNCEWDVKTKVLDPHLLGGDHIVIARFEPTKEGFELAKLCANSLPTEKLPI